MEKPFRSITLDDSTGGTMTQTPLSERKRIVLWGLRNAGKSSLFNALLGQEASIVSDVAGTTTDTVTRAIEILPAGPVALTDTAGIDDTDVLGPQRVAQAIKALEQADVALWVTALHTPTTTLEREIINKLVSRQTALVAVITHARNGNTDEKKAACLAEGANEVHFVDNIEKVGHRDLLQALGTLLTRVHSEPTPLEGLVGPGQLVILVTPIDLAAPKGRLILPQVETLRDVIDREAAALVVKERELRYYHFALERADLVITDSQAFAKVAAEIPPEIPLTSFSLLFARKKGELEAMLPSLRVLTNLKPKSRILIWEACRHHRQADDIATVKIPRLIQGLYQPETTFELKRDWPEPEELKNYDLVLACGGCSVTRRRMCEHMERARQAGVPVLNYGLFFAFANGLFPRALMPFPEFQFFRERVEDLAY
jgi:[FeFe] hydrogenase H-cluster maturation GTPase HydF